MAQYGSFQDTVTLSNGVKMPQFGFGTVFIREPMIRWAIQNGLRNIDTATDYANDETIGEEEVGMAIKNCGLPREDVFVTTKVWNSSHGYEETLKAFEVSRKALQLDYIDLYLIHWPCPLYDKYIDTWKALEKLYKEGLVRAIGVSNFMSEWIERIKNECEILPMVNQMECHLFYQQRDVLEYCRANGIQMEAYSPMAHGKINDSFVVQNIAKKYGKTCSQIAIRFLYQEKICFIPRSTKESRILEYMDSFDFCLEEEDMQILRSLSTAKGRIGEDPYVFNELKNLKEQIAEREANKK